MTRNEWLQANAVANERDNELVARCYDTLMANVYVDDGYLWSPYKCITPGMNHFRGIWNWDSAFHAIGVSRWDTEIAKDCILGFMQFQRPDGLLPDVIFENGNIVAGFSKPPVFAWATEVVYKRDGDIELLKSVYPRLVASEAHWSKKRKYEGLFFYDCDAKHNPDYRMHVKFESGWDNAVRWDKWLVELWPIDLNCFMVSTYRSMAYIANELGLTEEAAVWAEKEAELAKLINEKLWDAENKRYVDVNRFTGEYSDVLSPASFMPLFVNIASQEQAEAMGKIAEENFQSKMPTVSFDNPEFSNDYWRGPTWLNVAYFAAKGLKQYGLPVADVIRENILNMVHNEKKGICETYNSITGEGCDCDHFSWSSVFVIEFVLNW